MPHDKSIAADQPPRCPTWCTRPAGHPYWSGVRYHHGPTFGFLRGEAAEEPGNPALEYSVDFIDEIELGDFTTVNSLIRFAADVLGASIWLKTHVEDDPAGAQHIPVSIAAPLTAVSVDREAGR